MFSQERPDPSIQGQENYRRIGPECSGLQIKKSELDPATLRALIRCFNANGSIPEFAALVNDASEKTLAQSVEILNIAFLSDPKILAESRGVINQLESEKKWVPLVSAFQTILQDPERLRALVRLLSLGGIANGKSTVMPNLLPETIGEVSSAEAMAGFELLGRLVRSKAFRELQKKIITAPLAPAEQERLLMILMDFLKRETPHRSASLLADDMVAGKSSALWSFIFGADADDAASVLVKSSRFYTLLSDFGANQGKSLRQLSLFHQSFYRPVSCWGGGKVFLEPWKNLNEEILQNSSESKLLPFFARFASLTAISIGDICEIPSGFYDHYPSIMKFTAGRSGGAYLDMVRHIFTSGMGRSAGYFVGEWGESLADVLTIVGDRPWFPDLILLLAELDSNDRDRISGWVNALLKNRGAWTEKSASWSSRTVGDFLSDLGFLFSADSQQLSLWIESVHTLFESSRAHPWFQGWKKIAMSGNEMDAFALTALPSFPSAAKTLGTMAGDGRLASVLGDILELLGGGARVSLEGSAAIREVVIPRTLRHTFSGSDLRELDTSLVFNRSLLACVQLDLRKRPAQQWELYSECLSGGGVGEKALAGLLKAQVAPFPDAPSDSFLASIMKSFFTLPLSISEKQEVIKLLTGKNAGLKGFTADLIPMLVQVNRDFFTPVLSIFARIQNSLGMGPSTWNPFFAKVEGALLDPRFSSAIQSLRGLEKLENPFYQQVIGPAPVPNETLLVRAVSDVECISDVNDARLRGEEITREFQDGVLGWERPNGKIPLTWREESLQPRLRALSDTLESDSLRKNLYQWITKLEPKDAASWFINRSQDPRLVAVMDPETRKPVLRWMTTLDRLESILVNSNFSQPLSGNYGLKFIKKFAESWGDEPRANWPREIQKRYSGRAKPPTLRETYEDVLKILHGFERVGGMPAIPACVESTLVSKSWTMLPDFVLSFSVKTKAYNLKQTLSVIEENLPDSGSLNAGGMRLLRDLFWAVHSSSNAEKNSILFLQRFGDLGGLRMLSRGLQAIETQGELAALEDVFGGLAGWVSEPAFDRILFRVIQSPSSLEKWVSAAFDGEFDFSKAAVDFFGVVAVDRSFRIGPSVLNTIEQALPNEGLPEALVADLIHLYGSVSGGARASTVSSLRPKDVATQNQLLIFSDYFRDQGVTLLRALPISKLLQMLDRDPLLRKDIFNRVLHIYATRQANGESSRSAHPSNPAFRAYLELLLSKESPELRRMIALWCGKSAGRYAFKFGDQPEEMSRVIDGLLQSADSDSFRDFLEALLRQLPD